MKISLTSIYNWYRNVIRNPKYRWWIIIGTFVYLLSPFDISPDFIPFIGEIDDLAVVSLLITEVSQMLLDGYKTRKNKTDVAESEVKSDTVDVDAVSVK